MRTGKRRHRRRSRRSRRRRRSRRKWRSRRGGWRWPWQQKEQPNKMAPISNQERREYSAALETAAHSNATKVTISRDAQRGQDHLKEKQARKQARVAAELKRTAGIRNKRKQMIKESGRAGQGGRGRTRKRRKRRK